VNEVKNGTIVKILETDRLYLRQHETEDAEVIYEWLNDPEIKRLTAESPRPLSKMKAREWLESWIKNENEVSLSVVTKKDDTLIGITALLDINTFHRSAELAIIIGEKVYWSQGYGSEVIQALLEYGFTQLNLNRIWLGVTDMNARAQRTYEKAGFVREGLLREKFYIEGAYHDDIMMSILRREGERSKK